VKGIVAAVDLGATSGRVMLGHVSPDEVRLEHILRFPNGPVQRADGLHWDIDELYRSILAGLRTALHGQPEIASIGVDSWAVDYALLREGRELGAPFHYRDDRNLPAVDVVDAIISPEELYARNGLQFLPFNTLYQFTADRTAVRLADAARFLLVPDRINFWLGGTEAAERTNASTTGLLGVTTGHWDSELISRLQVPGSIFPELVDAGTSLGGLSPRVIAELGGGGHLDLSTVGSHDTASAVVGVPAETDDFAYISCGTRGLVGVELEHPVLTEDSRLENFTNEGGVDGRIRYLHNVMGLWLLSESVRTWETEGTPIHLPTLLQDAAAVTSPMPLFDTNDARFLSPGDMPARIADWCTERGLAAPQTRPEFVRSILESLADAFARAVEKAAELSGKQVRVIHIVGGGSQNELLCQLTANRSGFPVIAGTVEATAIGNTLIQARTHGLITGDLEPMRPLVVRSLAPFVYSPQ
jgi:rhamnulokinase